MKRKELKAKVYRALGITKPIELSEADEKLILLCKLHYKDDKRFSERSGWIEILKPMHNEIYGWDADEHYRDFLRCMFQKLFDIHLKISLDHSGINMQLKAICGAGFEKTISRQYDLPIERCIAELCSQIQNNKVVEHGVNRYNLNKDLLALS